MSREVIPTRTNQGVLQTDLERCTLILAMSTYLPHSSVLTSLREDACTCMRMPPALD